MTDRILEINEKVDAEVKAELAKIEYELSNDEIIEFTTLIQLKYEHPDIFHKFFNDESNKKFIENSYTKLFEKFNNFVHPVYRHNDKIYLEHIGTCFLVSVGNMRFLVSARHIWDNYIFTSTKNINSQKILVEEHLACLYLGQIIPITGELIRGGFSDKNDIHIHKEEDFIVFNVTDLSFPSNISFLNLNFQDMNINKYNHLFFIGYANSKNKKTGIHQGSLKKHVSHFLSRKISDNENLIYQYYPKYAESILHPKKNTIKLNGCSGSPVFSFNGNINEAQIVGMLIEHNNNKITHIKIEVIFQVILQLYLKKIREKIIKAYNDED
ncbi:hypothetical protein [Acinetobacter baylyi]|uniref:hypothetical protein n=1 Tax=Acinetobacter baylyi TaxID=202950 RepID=UPI0031D68325